MATNIMAYGAADAYRELSVRLLDSPDYTINGTRELTNVTIEMLHPWDNMVTQPERKLSLAYIYREVAWYIAATPNPSLVSEMAKKWVEISDERGRVQSNYGTRLFSDAFTLQPQLEYVVGELQRNPYSRRAVAYIVTPQDFNSFATTKDFPCTIALHFMIRGSCLDLTAYMRSNDVVYGFGNDVPFFTLLQDLVAAKLNIAVGHYIHVATSLHVYDNMVKKLSREQTSLKPVFGTTTAADYDWVVGFNRSHELPNSTFQRLIYKELLYSRE